MEEKRPGPAFQIREPRIKELPKDVFVDLKKLSEWTSISVTTLRDRIKDPSNPLPAIQI
jgi:hypothetical protein